MVMPPDPFRVLAHGHFPRVLCQSHQLDVKGVNVVSPVLYTDLLFTLIKYSITKSNNRVIMDSLRFRLFSIGKFEEKSISTLFIMISI